MQQNIFANTTFTYLEAQYHNPNFSNSPQKDKQKSVLFPLCHGHIRTKNRNKEESVKARVHHVYFKVRHIRRIQYQVHTEPKQVMNIVDDSLPSFFGFLEVIYIFFFNDSFLVLFPKSKWPFSASLRMAVNLSLPLQLRGHFSTSCKWSGKQTISFGKKKVGIICRLIKFVLTIGIIYWIPQKKYTEQS